MSDNGRNIYNEYKLDTIHKNNIFNRGGDQMLQSGFQIHPFTGKFYVPIKSSPFYKPPWVFSNSTMDKKCGFWHAIIWEKYHLFPVGCLGCWKVVVRPRNVEELFRLLDYQQHHYEKECKCGIELRPFVHANYGGYFYNNGLDEGLACYRKVKEDVKEYVSVGTLYSPDGTTTDAPAVALKRACTEFELEYGDSSKWEDKLIDGTWALKQSPFQPMPLEDLIYSVGLLKDMIELPSPEIPEGMSHEQPGTIKVNVIQSWLEHAYAIGDATALKFNHDNLPFFTPSLFYHDRENIDADKFKTLPQGKEVG